MTERRFYVRKRNDKLSDHLETKQDSWSVASKRKLKASIRHKIKKVFVGILDELDKELEGGFLTDGIYQRLRAKTLNLGNEQVRLMENEIDNRYNVEALNYHVEFKVLPE